MAEYCHGCLDRQRQINELEAKLEAATKALEEISTPKYHDGELQGASNELRMMQEFASAALKSIREVKMKWLAYPQGRVLHAWKRHPINDGHVWSGCGEIVAIDYPVHKKGLPQCKKCARRKGIADDT